MKKGDKVTLYIPDVYDKYPDFVKEEWTIDDIDAFCQQYGITLEKKYQATSSYKPGQIIRQSRSAGSKIVSGATLIITIAEEPKVETPEPPSDSGTSSSGDSTGTTTGDGGNT